MHAQVCHHQRRRETRGNVQVHVGVPIRVCSVFKRILVADTRKLAATRAARDALAWLNVSISPLGITIV
jgi:hypothetical protein